MLNQTTSYSTFCKISYRLPTLILQTVPCMETYWVKPHDPPAAVLIDFSQAFDAVWHEGLNSKLISCNIPLPLVRWVCDFLRCRKFKIRINGFCPDVTYEIGSGVPRAPHSHRSFSLSSLAT